MHSPPPGDEDRPPVEAPIRPLPAVLMLLGIALVLTLESCTDDTPALPHALTGPGIEATAQRIG